MRSIIVLFLLFVASQLAAGEYSELLNAEERQWLDSLDRPLIFATETNYHPYNFVDDEGRFSGVLGDYVLLLQERLQFQYEVRTYATFAEVLEAAQRKEVDVVPLIIAAPERKGFLNFTQTAYETRDRIFTRKENTASLTLDDLGGMRVGIVEGYASIVTIAASHPAIDIVPVPDEEAGLISVSLGNIDAFIAEVGTSSYYIQQDGITNLRVAGEVEGSDAQTIASRKDWPILNSILGKGLASISDEERAEILGRWITVGGVDSREIEALWRKGGTVVGVIASLLIGTLVWTLSLRRLVARRTEELEQELEERRAVEASKLRLAVAVGQSAEFVLIVDTAGNIEYSNSAFHQAYGTTGLVGRPFNSLAGSDSQSTLTEALTEVHNAGSWRGQVVLRSEEDQEFKSKLHIVPIFDQGSTIDGYVATGRDVSHEEQLETRLRQSERLSALGTLAGGIAHDFNNLLVPIIGYTDLVREESSGEMVSFLDAISTASERARELVQRIMIFGRGGSGEMAAFDLRFEVEDSMSFLRNILPTTIAVEQELGECGAVLGDRTQMQQLLLNLCSNAGVAMAENGGTLTIRLAQNTVNEDDESAPPELAPGDYAVLTVQDTGVGMSEATREKIFDPYFTARAEDEGTGLGLAIVHGIVARHSGAIEVESAPHAGTTFRIYLPLATADTVEPVSEAGVTVPKGRGERVILVDDDELVLTTIKNMLQGLEYEVSVWSDPKAALVAFGADPSAFDILVADLTMPGMIGTELVKEIKAIRADIPTVIITGDSGALQDYDGRYLSKPLSMKVLSNCLREMLD